MCPWGLEERKPPEHRAPTHGEPGWLQGIAMPATQNLGGLAGVTPKVQHKTGQTNRSPPGASGLVWFPPQGGQKGRNLLFHCPQAHVFAVGTFCLEGWIVSLQVVARTAKGHKGNVQQWHRVLKLPLPLYREKNSAESPINTCEKLFCRVGEAGALTVSLTGA